MKEKPLPLLMEIAFSCGLKIKARPLPLLVEIILTWKLQKVS